MKSLMPPCACGSYVIHAECVAAEFRIMNARTELLIAERDALAVYERNRVRAEGARP